MQYVDNSIRVRNPEWEWHQKELHKQTPENGEKYLLKITSWYKGRNAAECTAGEREQMHNNMQFSDDGH